MNKKKENLAIKSRYNDLFLEFRLYLDNKHDRRERLVKLSRDLTINSKRIIFTLHRTPISDFKQSNELKDYYSKIHDILLNIEKELSAIPDRNEFSRASTAGFQEFSEAISFHYWLTYDELLVYPVTDLEKIDYQPLRDCLRVVKMSLLDYFLGISDLTGELMRYCITSVGRSDFEVPFRVCSFVQKIYNLFISIAAGGVCSTELDKKLHAMRQSLYKIERACYNLQIRGSEMSKDSLANYLLNENDNNNNT